ncbi:hypothetical protein [uncultured Tenacibaculum sp.]|uniref:hypothetical protein n=1 Tax=uncultured Tenacibaculum sp. TaxID=174713 RepID=UPI0026223DC1|nr:hypothetical protein [uncultured Tenacibaculum sp.]
MYKVSKNIKCGNCGVFTENSDYCKNCGELISFRKKKEIKEEEEKKKRIEEAKLEIENPNLAERLKKHPFFLYKIVGWVLYSAFLVVSAIGAMLAWFIAMVAAG